MKLDFERGDKVVHKATGRAAIVIHYDKLANILYIQMEFDSQLSPYWVCDCGIRNWQTREKCRGCSKEAGQEQPQCVIEARTPVAYKVVERVRTSSS